MVKNIKTETKKSIKYKNMKPYYLHCLDFDRVNRISTLTYLLLLKKLFDVHIFFYKKMDIYNFNLVSTRICCKIK